MISGSPTLAPLAAAIVSIPAGRIGDRQGFRLVLPGGAIAFAIAFAASAVAGVLWTVISASAAFLYVLAWMLVAIVSFVGVPGESELTPNQLWVVDFTYVSTCVCAKHPVDQVRWPPGARVGARGATLRAA